MSEMEISRCLDEWSEIEMAGTACKALVSCRVQGGQSVYNNVAFMYRYIDSLDKARQDIGISKLFVLSKMVRGVDAGG